MSLLTFHLMKWGTTAKLQIYYFFFHSDNVEISLMTKKILFFSLFLSNLIWLSNWTGQNGKVALLTTGILSVVYIFIVRIINSICKIHSKTVLMAVCVIVTHTWTRTRVQNIHVCAHTKQYIFIGRNFRWPPCCIVHRKEIYDSFLCKRFLVKFKR